MENETGRNEIAEKSIACNDDSLQKSLEFARRVAKDEIDSIERLHNRALKALSIPLAGFVLLFSCVGWIGYLNLKHVAVQTATDVVKERLADELTQKNIDTAVQYAVREHAADQIANAVNKQVASAITKHLTEQAPELRDETSAMTAKAISNLQPQIEAFAKQQALRLISEANEPRQLSLAQRQALIDYAKRTPHLSVNVAVGGDSEAQHYAALISQSLEAGGWKVERQALLSSYLDLPSYGLVLAVVPALQGSSTVTELVNCLTAANLKPQLRASPKSAEWGEETTLIVMPKAR
ncbi:hypothetical protein [Silvibacterium acidisoli]|uniref:hypothetical protein n=1 Tax=Acidobacteriaceae bacterium ZG23-2 TaxID=2883246 RepID=UPI00406C1CFE